MSLLILGCGGRDFTDRAHVREVLGDYADSWRGPPTIMHGAARGADTLLGEEAGGLGFSVQKLPANWERDGKRAGVLRNLQMLDRKPDLVLAFPGGKGTAHTVAEAERRGIPVRQVNPRAPSERISQEPVDDPPSDDLRDSGHWARGENYGR